MNRGGWEHDPLLPSRQPAANSHPEVMDEPSLDRRESGGSGASASQADPSAAASTGTTPTAHNTGSIRRRTSVSEKTPTRSFYHRSFHGPLDAGHYSSQGVRQQTAELESLALSESESIQSLQHSLPKHDGIIHGVGAHGKPNWSGERPSDRFSTFRPEVIEERSEPTTPRNIAFPTFARESALTTMIRTSPPSHPSEEEGPNSPRSTGAPDEDENEPADLSKLRSRASMYSYRLDPEREPLIRHRSKTKGSQGYGSAPDNLDDGPTIPRIGLYGSFDSLFSHIGACAGPSQLRNICNPKNWNRGAIVEKGIKLPVSLLPAVFLGLLLNILDALSYGMILFPLGQPLFASLGSAGISMFYVSTIISQLVISCGGSIFKGGIGSEMIEVVPFFHSMALSILERVGEDNPKSVLATTILAFSISSVMTGAVFFAMGACGLGSLIGFFPRHILIGCIGGVGWFLVATGVEVSARLSGNLEYNLDTLEKLFQLDTIFLWTVPLAFAIGLLVLKRYLRSNFLLGGYFLCLGAGFYIVKFVIGVPLQSLRDHGWVFQAPASSTPWYHFYTLYDFQAVDWSALADTIPAMFAVTFFGILHVPINVPALGISTGEDNLNVDRELLAHGVSNALSGLMGSVQNYLVYTNSLLFIASGGNHRLAGIMLAAGTFGIMLIGPGIIGYIPIMVVGALIFMLGIELMEEALVDTWGKLHKLEYITVVAIVVTMGAWDFVTGIFVGIMLACVNFVALTSQKSAISATYTGQVAKSTVRRHPTHARFLREAGKQTYVVKLAGFLFFGTIVSVEKRIRHLIDRDVFRERPIRFLILDALYVNGLDFSAAEAFTRLNRILQKRGVYMSVCGLDITGEVGRSLQNVGLFEQEDEVGIFPDLNSALEYCENELLKTYHSHKDKMMARNEPRGQNLMVHDGRLSVTSTSDLLAHTPRKFYLQQLASDVLKEEEEELGSGKASSRNLSPALHHEHQQDQQQQEQEENQQQPFPQPLPLLMQTFHGASTKPAEFWLPACLYFTRAEFPTSSVLYREGEFPHHFYLLESGMLRAEYQTPQGSYFELTVAGRPCGELPFFGETNRTATVRAERDSVVWTMGTEDWEQLRTKEPELALEMMKVCLKLTSERMESITSYVLTATR
ncbi:hypothetical protein FQN57_005157 [Myotisia sp. PD_48]|nr:hypothetical protein FQN57_005157 [Myotisia sp. PD_48]